MASKINMRFKINGWVIEETVPMNKKCRCGFCGTTRKRGVLYTLYNKVSKSGMRVGKDCAEKLGLNPTGEKRSCDIAWGITETDFKTFTKAYDEVMIAYKDVVGQNIEDYWDDDIDRDEVPYILEYSTSNFEEPLREWRIYPDGTVICTERQEWVKDKNATNIKV